MFLPDILSFNGEQNKDSDPLTREDWRRLQFLERSASVCAASLINTVKKSNWSHSRLHREFAANEQIHSYMQYEPGTGPYWHRRWVESLAHFNPLTYEFEESEESARVKTEVALYLEVRREVRAELIATGKSPSRYQQRIWREFRERLKARTSGKVEEIGTSTHSGAGNVLHGTFGDPQSVEEEDTE